MEQVSVSLDDLAFFRFCQIKDRPDWWAVFSVEPDGKVFVFVTRGWTQLQDRVYLRDESPKLAEIANIYLDFRRDGGRFFINHKGAYFHVAEYGPYDQFIEFTRTESVHYVPPSKQK